MAQVLKLCTYLAQRPAATRVSKRLSLVEDFEEEQMSHGGVGGAFGGGKPRFGEGCISGDTPGDAPGDAGAPG